MLDAIKDLQEANEPEIVSQTDEFSPEVMNIPVVKKSKKSKKEESEIVAQEDNQVEVDIEKTLPKRFKMTKDYTISVSPRPGISITLSFRKNQIISDPDTLKHLGNEAPMIPSE